MNAKIKGAGAAVALLGLGAFKACSKVALVASHGGGETAALGLSHSAPAAIHAMEFGAGDTANLARSALHQTDALGATGASAHTIGDAAAASGDDASHGMSNGVTHTTEHEHGFLHKAGEEIAKEGIKQWLEPERENRNDPRPYESLYRNSDGITGSTEGSR
jgi:hypothetical protein